MAFTDTNDFESWIPIQSEDDLVTVEAIGMGCVLMKTELFKKLEKPYFEYTYQDNSSHLKLI